MGKKVEVSYNPQLGYLQTIFHHNFDFLTGIKSYTERTDGVEFVVDTYKENTVKVSFNVLGKPHFVFVCIRLEMSILLIIVYIS